MVLGVWWQHSWQVSTLLTSYGLSGLLLLAATGLLLVVLMRQWRASARPAHRSPAHTSTPGAKAGCSHGTSTSIAAVHEVPMQLACTCGVKRCQHQPELGAGAQYGVADADEPHAESHTTRTLDCTTDAAPAVAPSSCNCCNSTSVSKSSKPYHAANSLGITRRRPQQQSGSCSQQPVLHAHVRSTACLATSPAKASCPSNPARLSPVKVKVITSFDSDASTPDSSPCSSRPTHFATLRVKTSQPHDQDCSDATPLSPCTSSDSSSSSLIPPAAIGSPVGGLVVVTAARMGAAGLQDHPLDVQAGDDSSSSDQHELGSSFLPRIPAGAAGVQGAFRMQQAPAQLGDMDAKSPASHPPEPVESSEAWATVTVAQCGSGKLSIAQGSHQPHAQCSSSTSQAVTGSTPGSAGGLPQLSVNETGSSTEQHGHPAGQQEQKRGVRVSFAPLPPSKNTWLQQLRQMSPEGKAKFLRRLQLVGRRVWCMWRRRTRQQQQQQPQGPDKHGVKRDWQQAAAESQSDDTSDDAAGGCGPCKRAVGQGSAFLRCRDHRGGHLSQPMLLG